MPDVFSTIGPFTFRTYTFLIGVGIIISGVWAIYALRETHRAGRIVDAGIAGLISGLIVSRGFHVLLNWVYFSEHTAEITEIKSGGLNWHGAVIGAFIAIVIVGRIRKLDIPALLGALAPAVLIIGFMAWWGCGSANCSYGMEVDNLSNYPSWLVWEARDIYNLIFPRYRTQALGMGLAFVLIVLFIAIIRRDLLSRHPARRFWLMLGLFSLSMFGLGYLRGDYAYMFELGSLGELRADQVLDLGFMLMSSMIFLWRSSQLWQHAPKEESEISVNQSNATES